jgi:hypothetical protein
MEAAAGRTGHRLASSSRTVCRLQLEELDTGWLHLAGPYGGWLQLEELDTGWLHLAELYGGCSWKNWTQAGFI